MRKWRHQQWILQRVSKSKTKYLWLKPRCLNWTFFKVFFFQVIRNQKNQSFFIRIYFHWVLMFTWILNMFTQHAAEAENADNAAEQKRQMNKRVRYGEIVQVTWNKCKYEGIITNCTINPQNSVNVHVYIINRIYLLNDLGHVPIFFTLVCFRITRIFTYIGKKKYSQNRSTSRY